jgi:hypothetical protein
LAAYRYHRRYRHGSAYQVPLQQVDGGVDPIRNFQAWNKADHVQDRLYVLDDSVGYLPLTAAIISAIATVTRLLRTVGPLPIAQATARINRSWVGTENTG